MSCSPLSAFPLLQAVLWCSDRGAGLHGASWLCWLGFVLAVLEFALSMGPVSWRVAFGVVFLVADLCFPEGVASRFSTLATVAPRGKPADDQNPKSNPQYPARCIVAIYNP